MNSLRKHKVTPHQRDTYYLDLFVHKYMFFLFGDLWHFFSWFWGFQGFASSHKPVRWGVGGEQKIVAKRDPSVYNSAWESIFQMNVDYHCPTWKLDFLFAFGDWNFFNLSVMMYMFFRWDESNPVYSVANIVQAIKIWWYPGVFNFFWLIDDCFYYL